MTHHLPWLTIYHDSPSIMTHHLSWLTIYHDSPSIMTHHLSWLTIYHDSPSIMTHHLSWLTIYHDSPSIMTHHRSLLTIYHDSPSITTHHLSRLTIYHDSPSITTHHLSWLTIYHDSPSIWPTCTICRTVRCSPEHRDPTFCGTASSERPPSKPRGSPSVHRCTWSGCSCTEDRELDPLCLRDAGDSPVNNPESNNQKSKSIRQIDATKRWEEWQSPQSRLHIIYFNMLIIDMKYITVCYFKQKNINIHLLNIQNQPTL